MMFSPFSRYRWCDSRCCDGQSPREFKFADERKIGPKRGGLQSFAQSVSPAGFYGVRLLFGARMNRLVFNMRDGLTLEWKSRAGSFKYTRDAALKVEEFAKQKGLSA